MLISRHWQEEHILLVVAYIAVGAFIGFAVSYKFKLDNSSQAHMFADRRSQAFATQDILLFFIRLIACLLIFAGTNNFFVSTVSGRSALIR